MTNRPFVKALPLLWGAACADPPTRAPAFSVAPGAAVKQPIHIAVPSSQASAAPASPRLSREYPGVREVHGWRGGHAHSILWASVDPPEQVRAYYRRYAAQNPGYEVTEALGELVLDGGGAMGAITIAPATTGAARLHSGEQTVISSSRP